MSTFGEHLEVGHVEEKLRRAYSETDRLRRTLRAEKERTGRLVAATESAVHEAVSSIVIPKVAKPPLRKQALGKEEVAVAWVSDIQLGKNTPNYNSDVAEERMERYAAKVVKLANMHRSAVPINKIHVWMLGDIVEGEDIFPGQQWLIDSSLYEQAMNRGPRILANFVRTMLANFDEVKVSAVIGNHGRIGRKGAMHPETNTDRMCYKVTQTILNDEIESGRLVWSQNDPGNSGDRGWYEVDEIGDYTALLVHGDQFKGSMGIPWYGVRKKVLGWHAMAENNLPFPHFDDVAFGHWHQSVTWTINDIGVMGNGSVESWNDYAAENLAGMGRPSQRLMFVSPGRGLVTSHYPEIWLD